MPNMSPNKVKMPEQDPNVRNKNFEEVSLGYTKEQAMEEATRCLNCKKPFCMDGCPVGVPIPEFIHHVAEGEFEEAYQTITRENALPAICGRVCPQENQCEGKCVRGIKTESVGIGRLERFVADYHREHGKPTELKIEKNGKKVAVIGSGPAGITCAGELAKKGYDVTVFEALHKTGGVLSYGIPEFRLPKKLVQSEVDGVAALGVDFQTNVVVGRSITIDELQEQGYQGIFVGSGAGLPRFQGISGENLNGVYAANEFLTRVNLMKGYQFPDHPTPVKVTDTVCVIGAGNVAIYATQKAQQLGAKVVTVSDSTGWIYDPEGIDVELLKEVKEVKRARLTEYAAARKSAEYHEGRGVWSVKCDVALPCATQNELHLDDAKALVANGVIAVAEGANMPTTLEATEYLQENGVLFAPGKASNAGGVATSALEMSQNSERLSWTFDEVDAKLQGIMVNIFHACDDASKKYGFEKNYVVGANIAGFEKVAEAMTAQGIV